jgi:dTDP-4-amino-4,6-dideoxygalactose transaminase
MTVPFNKPFLSGNELEYIQEAVRLGKISGNGEFTRRCQDFFERRYGFQKCLLTTSCTDALEMAAILLDIQPGDEVIVPSFTFVSSANAFVLRGAKIVFVDSKSDHPNLDESLLEALITPRTKVVVVVHYGGVPCEMDTIMEIAERNGLFVVEDAAQAIDQAYKGSPLGSIGHLGAFSFHETKNIQCGEGGMLAINDPSLIRRGERIWEKGTDRVAFSRGEIKKYGWVDVGSSFLPSELNAAYLWAQLENLDSIQNRRKAIWQDYFGVFTDPAHQCTLLNLQYASIVRSLKLKDEGFSTARNTNSNANGILNFPIPHLKFLANAHLFYLLFPDLDSRSRYVACLREKGILSVFHYQSLHRSDFAKTYFPDQYSRNLPHSDRFSDCLLRLPMFYELPEVCRLAFPG